MKYKIYIPSFGRAGQVTTLQFLPEATIVVPESQREEYQKFYPKSTVIIRDEQDGNIARKRNAILELARQEKIDNVIMIDDDFVKAAHTITARAITGAEMLRIFEQGFRLCADLGLHYFGMNNSFQPLHQEVNRPFSFGRFFYTIQGIRITDIRFDESLTRQEDMDFWLQHIRKDKAVLKFNHIGIECRMKDEKQDGGIEGKEETTEDGQKLYKKWGTSVLNWDRQRAVFLTPKSPYKSV